jgi:hypothetical protein
MKEYSKGGYLKNLVAVSSMAIMLGGSVVSFASADGGRYDDNNQDSHHRNDARWDKRDYRWGWKNKRENRNDQSKRWGWDKKNWVVLWGRVDSVDSDEVTIVTHDKTYKVDISDATLLDRRGEKIKDDDIDKGDRVIVRGTKDGSSIDAQRVRDISAD